MRYDKEIHHRRSIRLKDYDYSQAGAYFVTICTKERECFFGNVIDDRVILSEIGKVARKGWLDIPLNFQNLELDEFMVMPNHIHGIIIFNDGRGLINQAPTNQTPTDTWILMKNPEQTLGKIIRFYKARTSNSIHDKWHPDFKWQRNYYEHIIRNEKELNSIREYIRYNPLKWDEDEENPDREKRK